MLFAGWYLGGCPTCPSQLPPGPAPALLDVTCDMPRCLEAAAYKLLPAWETHGERGEGASLLVVQSYSVLPPSIGCHDSPEGPVVLNGGGAGGP